MFRAGHVTETNTFQNALPCRYRNVKLTLQTCIKTHLSCKSFKDILFSLLWLQDGISVFQFPEISQVLVGNPARKYPLVHWNKAIVFIGYPPLATGSLL